MTHSYHPDLQQRHTNPNQACTEPGRICTETVNTDRDNTRKRHPNEGEVWTLNKKRRVLHRKGGGICIEKGRIVRRNRVHTKTQRRSQLWPTGEKEEIQTEPTQESLYEIGTDTTKPSTDEVIKPQVGERAAFTKDLGSTTKTEIVTREEIYTNNTGPHSNCEGGLHDICSDTTKSPAWETNPSKAPKRPAPTS